MRIARTGSLRDRDPAQREAEGPKSSMDYSEFFISTKKNPDVPVLGPYASRIARRSHARVKQHPLQSALLLHTLLPCFGSLCIVR